MGESEVFVQTNARFARAESAARGGAPIAGGIGPGARQAGFGRRIAGRKRRLIAAKHKGGIKHDFVIRGVRNSR